MKIENMPEIPKNFRWNIRSAGVGGHLRFIQLQQKSLCFWLTEVEGSILLSSGGSFEDQTRMAAVKVLEEYNTAKFLPTGVVE